MKAGNTDIGRNLALRRIFDTGASVLGIVNYRDCILLRLGNTIIGRLLDFRCILATRVFICGISGCLVKFPDNVSEISSLSVDCNCMCRSHTVSVFVVGTRSLLALLNTSTAFDEGLFFGLGSRLSTSSSLSVSWHLTTPGLRKPSGEGPWPHQKLETSFEVWLDHPGFMTLPMVHRTVLVPQREICAGFEEDNNPWVQAADSELAVLLPPVYAGVAGSESPE